MWICFLFVLDSCNFDNQTNAKKNTENIRKCEFCWCSIVIWATSSVSVSWKMFWLMQNIEWMLLFHFLTTMKHFAWHCQIHIPSAWNTWNCAPIFRMIHSLCDFPLTRFFSMLAFLTLWSQKCWKKEQFPLTPCSFSPNEMPDAKMHITEELWANTK